jgi:voltage-gated potassium channel Kch
MKHEEDKIIDGMWRHGASWVLAGRRPPTKVSVPCRDSIRSLQGIAQMPNDVHGSSDPKPQSGAAANESLFPLLGDRSLPWKFFAGGCVLLLATLGFSQIEITGGRRLHLLESLYQAMRLFVLGAEGTPQRGPVFWLFTTWLMYFLAPGVTATVLIEWVYRVARSLRTPERAVRRLKGHIILCGLGKHGRLIVQHVLDHDPTFDVVVVDNDPALPSFLELSPTKTAPVIRGEMTDAATLRRAGVERARKVFAMSGGDVVNLNACLVAKEKNLLPGSHAIALVSDIGLSRGVAELARQEGVITLNPYEIAARNLVEQLANTMGPEQLENCPFIVAGFGRFGQMFAKAMLERSSGQKPGSRMVVIDRQATRRLASFRFGDEQQRDRLIPLEGEIGDPRILEQAFERSQAQTQEKPAIVLCTDDDANNLNTALLIREHWGTRAVVLTRLFNPPPRFRELTSDSSIRSFHLPDLIVQELPAECY